MKRIVNKVSKIKLAGRQKVQPRLNPQKIERPNIRKINPKALEGKTRGHGLDDYTLDLMILE